MHATHVCSTHHNTSYSTHHNVLILNTTPTGFNMLGASVSTIIFAGLSQFFTALLTVTLLHRKLSRLQTTGVGIVILGLCMQSAPAFLSTLTNALTTTSVTSAGHPLSGGGVSWSGVLSVVGSTLLYALMGVVYEQLLAVRPTPPHTMIMFTISAIGRWEGGGDMCGYVGLCMCVCRVCGRAPPTLPHMHRIHMHLHLHAHLHPPPLVHGRPRTHPQCRHILANGLLLLAGLCSGLQCPYLHPTTCIQHRWGPRGVPGQCAAGPCCECRGGIVFLQCIHTKALFDGVGGGECVYGGGGGVCVGDFQG